MPHTSASEFSIQRRAEADLRGDISRRNTEHRSIFVLSPVGTPRDDALIAWLATQFDSEKLEKESLAENGGDAGDSEYASRLEEIDAVFERLCATRSDL